MRKLTLALAITAALVSSAHAETVVTLEPSSCTQTFICPNVPNDSGQSIDYIAYSSRYGRLSASINGVLWDSGLWAVLGQGPAFTSVPLYDGTGVIYLTITFAGGQVTGPCVQSGRVCVFPRAPVTIT